MATTISVNDVIFATAMQSGRSFANIKLSGMDSTCGVLAEIRRLAGGVIGLVHVTLRNATQGWCKRISLYLRDAGELPEGTQLSLF